VSSARSLGTITGLFIYPVKGLAGVSLTESAVEREGLRHDRRYMIVGQDNVFRSQRQIPAMATLRPQIKGDALVITNARGESIVTNLPEADPEPVTVWNSTVLAYGGDYRADAWLSRHLQEPVRLVRMGSATDRPVSPDFADPGDRVSFADGFPILLANDTSLADLNQRLLIPIPMDRFSANVVVSGIPGEPWAEDTFGHYQIGELAALGNKLCARCQVPTIDQATGERTGSEPLTTLAQFRTIEGKVMFGMNLIPRLGAQGPTIRLGDPVAVTPADPAA